MIDYKLYAELCSAINEKYSNKYEIYREEPPTVYVVSPKKGVWDNNGIKIIDGLFTVAVLCEFDQNQPQAGVYIGVKVLDKNSYPKYLSEYLKKQNLNGCNRPTELSDQHRLFSWPYWESISSVDEGIALFDKLVNDCYDFLSQQIF